jgi:hypothetical protein
MVGRQQDSPGEGPFAGGGGQRPVAAPGGGDDRVQRKRVTDDNAGVVVGDTGAGRERNDA